MRNTKQQCYRGGSGANSAWNLSMIVYVAYKTRLKHVTFRCWTPFITSVDAMFAILLLQWHETITWIQGGSWYLNTNSNGLGVLVWNFWVRDLMVRKKSSQMLLSMISSQIYDTGTVWLVVHLAVTRGECFFTTLAPRITLIAHVISHFTILIYCATYELNLLLNRSVLCVCKSVKLYHHCPVPVHMFFQKKLILVKNL